MDEKPNIREQITRQYSELDGLEALIREQLSSQISSENSEQQNNLSTKLAMVSAMRQGLDAGIPLSSHAIQASMSDIVANASTEQTRDKKYSNIASVIGEIAVREAELASEAKEFRDYEHESFGNIQANAEAQGIDISEIEAKRDALLKDREAAIAAGDTLGSYKSDVGLAQNNMDGLDAVGASEAEKKAAKEQYDRAQARYMEQAKIEAERKAHAMGLTGEQRQAYVATAVETAETALEEQQSQIGQQLGVNEPIQLEDKAARVTILGQEKAAINEMTKSADVVTDSFAPLIEGMPQNAFEFDEADLLDDKVSNLAPLSGNGPQQLG